MRLEKDLNLTPLSTVELDCLKKCAESISDEQIGIHMVLSPAEVKTTLSTTLTKLGAPNRMAAIAKAIRLGIIDIPQS